MEFIENLTIILNKKGISKNKLAKDIGISEGTIRSWEKGKYPTIDKLIKISEYFNISTDELLGLNNPDEELIKAYYSADQGTRDCINKLLDLKPHKEKTSLTSKIG